MSRVGEPQEAPREKQNSHKGEPNPQTKAGNGGVRKHGSRGSARGGGVLGSPTGRIQGLQGGVQGHLVGRGSVLKVGSPREAVLQVKGGGEGTGSAQLQPFQGHREGQRLLLGLGV